MGNIRAVHKLTGVTAAALLLASWGPAEAEAQGVACGQTVTRSITLQDDLADCPSGKNGLTIGADGITINLNGQNVVGSGFGIGIDNSDGHSGLKVVGNGSISGFVDGVVIRDASGAQLIGLTIQGNAGIGLHVADSQKGRFLNVTVKDNHAGGAKFADGADSNEIRGSRFNGNGGDGLVVGGDTNMVIGNWANDNKGDGFRIESANTTVKANIANKNAKLGIDAKDGASDAGGNRADGNGASPQCTGVVCS